ncbi:MAG: hypothetical protein KHX91_09345 [Clostridium sp.]|nr:hypothetical protein [Clostridium sp.]
MYKKSFTFGEWALKWLTTYKLGKVKMHTYNYIYRIHIEKYMIPYVGNSDLTSITQANI